LVRQSFLSIWGGRPNAQLTKARVGNKKLLAMRQPMRPEPSLRQGLAADPSEPTTLACARTSAALWCCVAAGSHMMTNQRRSSRSSVGATARPNCAQSYRPPSHSARLSARHRTTIAGWSGHLSHFGKRFQKLLLGMQNIASLISSAVRTALANDCSRGRFFQYQRKRRDSEPQSHVSIMTGICV
jgi:hypothetical protein